MQAQAKGNFLYVIKRRRWHLMESKDRGSQVWIKGHEGPLGNKDAGFQITKTRRAWMPGGSLLKAVLTIPDGELRALPQ